MSERNRRLSSGENNLVGQRVRQAEMAAAAKPGQSPYEQVLERCRTEFQQTFTAAQLDRPAPEDRRHMTALVLQQVRQEPLQPWELWRRSPVGQPW